MICKDNDVPEFRWHIGELKEAKRENGVFFFKVGYSGLGEENDTWSDDISVYSVICLKFYFLFKDR
jgi:hypothetical protein